MKNVPIQALEKYLLSIFKGCGLTDENAEIATDVVIRATMRGAGHHDIYMLEQHVRPLLEGKIVANPEFLPIAAYYAIESWDAGNGLGEVCCTFGMNKAMELADKFGVGVCALRNTNHFLAASPYVERAAEKGYIAVMLAKGDVNLGAPGMAGNCMSQLPMGFAYGTDKSYPVMMDMCMAYASLGVLDQKASRGEKVNPWWGLDANGNPTTDPKELRRGTRFPIGGHKGFALALFGEVLTGVMSNGCILDEKETEDGVSNYNSHTAIAIKADALMDAKVFRKRAGVLQDRATALSPRLHIPGQGYYQSKMNILERGYFELEDTLIERLNRLAEEIKVDKLL